MSKKQMTDLEGRYASLIDDLLCALVHATRLIAAAVEKQPMRFSDLEEYIDAGHAVLVQTGFDGQPLTAALPELNELLWSMGDIPEQWENERLASTGNDGSPEARHSTNAEE